MSVSRVVIADDEPIFRMSLRQLLAMPPAVVAEVYRVDVGNGFEVVGEAASGEETVEIVRTARPDVLLLDVSMPRRSGLDALRDLDPRAGCTHTILLSGALDPPDLAAAIQLGVRGVVRKDAATELLFHALTRVVAGELWVHEPLLADLFELVRTLAAAVNGGISATPFHLTPREREVLALVVEGCNNREIAVRFAVSEETIKHHLTRMFDKVGAANRVELALAATRHGLVH